MPQTSTQRRLKERRARFHKTKYDYDSRQRTHVTITVTGNTAQLAGNYPEWIVDEAISWQVPGFQFAPRFKKGWWDGKEHLFNKKQKTFPAGLLRIVGKALRRWSKKAETKIGIKVVRIGDIPEPIGKTFDLYGAVLRDYQLEGAKKLVEAQRGILKIATNGGKTFTFAAVIRYLGLKTLFIVPGKELLYQVRDEFKKLLHEPIGLIGDGRWSPQDITIAIPATLASRLKSKDKAKKAQVTDFLNTVQVVCADECHGVGAKGPYDVLTACPAPYRYGLSGTPLSRSDGGDMKLIAQTGEVVYEVSNKELIRLGVSTEVEVQFIPIDEDVPDALDWQKAYQKGVVENEPRNFVIVETCEKYVKDGLNCLILVKAIEHGVILDELLNAPHKFIHGDLSSEERRDAISDFRAGDLRILIATKILDQGVSINNIDVLVMAAGGKSRIQTLQRVGRGLRKGGNSDTLRVIDFSDMGNTYLAKHSLQRLHDYKAEGCFKIVSA